MGLKGYFKNPQVEEVPTASPLTPPVIDSTDNISPQPWNRSSTTSPVSALRRSDSRMSVMTSATGRSALSNRDSYFMDIRHEVMLNFLYQKQCSSLWIDPASEMQCEGTVLRKARGQYIACPPSILDSAFAAGCTALNLQVSNYLSGDVCVLTCSRWP